MTVSSAFFTHFCRDCGEDFLDPGVLFLKGQKTACFIMEFRELFYSEAAFVKK